MKTVGLITLNPCVDKTLFLDELPAEGIHTAREVTFLAGGKGNNVSRVMGRFGLSRKSLVMIAGPSGQHVRELLSAEGIPAEYLEVTGLSRTITTLVGRDWRQLAVKERGPQVSPADVERIKTRFLDLLAGIDFLCLSGTVPSESLWDFPAWAIGEAKKRGCPVSFDSDGEALRRGLDAVPDIVKPNGEEIREAWGVPVDGPDDWVAVMRRMLALGIRHPILSLGEHGAVSTWDGNVYHVISPRIRLVNSVGSGDSFVAALLYAHMNGMVWSECLRWASAAGAANAARWEAAGVGPEDIQSLLNQVRFTRLGEV